ncbi:MAG: hypothetical protein OJF51_002465 [Nitrospira sp.]|nr:MAG: hypothetical protein OJF51_002465 [Nitrospira sp.]
MSVPFHHLFSRWVVYRPGQHKWLISEWSSGTTIVTVQARGFVERR